MKTLGLISGMAFLTLFGVQWNHAVEQVTHPHDCVVDVVPTSPDHKTFVIDGPVVCKIEEE